jgi:tripartite-type tricarboxylate transporter receptor subunit TctC
MGLLAPAGTPRAIVDRLASAADRALKADEVLIPLRSAGFEAVGGGPDDFGRAIDRELKKWSDVAAAAGLRK